MRISSNSDQKYAKILQYFDLTIYRIFQMGINLKVIQTFFVGSHPYLTTLKSFTGLMRLIF